MNEDYLDINVNITFTSGQSSNGSNEQCFIIYLIDDNVLEGNETFSLLITPAVDDGVVNVTGGLVTVTITEDPNDSMICKVTTNAAVVTLCLFSPSTLDVRVGLIDARFTVTEAVDSSITLCAELQEGCLQRNLTLAIVAEGNNGKVHAVR